MMSAGVSVIGTLPAGLTEVVAGFCATLITAEAANVATRRACFIVYSKNET